LFKDFDFVYKISLYKSCINIFLQNFSSKNKSKILLAYLLAHFSVQGKGEPLITAGHMLSVSVV
jgi:hypothetical protein